MIKRDPILRRLKFTDGLMVFCVVVILVMVVLQFTQDRSGVTLSSIVFELVALVFVVLPHTQRVSMAMTTWRAYRTLLRISGAMSVFSSRGGLSLSV